METASVREGSTRVIAALSAAGKSRTTIKRHEAELNAFARFLQARGQDLPTEVDCLDFVAGRSGCRLAGLREPASSREAQLARRPSRDISSQSLPATRAIQQCASWRTGYYEHSVALGLAPGRRSRVRPCRTWQRDVGAPLIPLNALTGHRPPLRELHRQRDNTTQSGAPVSKTISGG